MANVATMLALERLFSRSSKEKRKKMSRDSKILNEEPTIVPLQSSSQGGTSGASGGAPNIPQLTGDNIKVLQNETKMEPSFGPSIKEPVKETIQETPITTPTGTAILTTIVREGRSELVEKEVKPSPLEIEREITQDAPKSKTKKLEVSPNTHIPKHLQQFNKDIEPVTDLERAIATLAENPEFRETIGQLVAYISTNEYLLELVTKIVKIAGKEKPLRRALGDVIADASGSSVVGAISRNSTVQNVAATTVMATAGNRNLLQKLGNAIARITTDRNVQRIVAMAIVKGIRNTWRGASYGIKNLGSYTFSQTKHAIRNKFRRRRRKSKL